MKKHVKMILAALLFVFVLAPTAKANAAVVTPATPGGLGIYSQDGSKVGLVWNLDNNLPNYSSAYIDFGFEVTITTLKNKSIAVIDKNTVYNAYDSNFGTKDNKVLLIVNNSKLKTQGFKFKVRSYVYDENQQKVYSAYSTEKVIIPRPTIKSKKMVGNKVKLTYNKVTGAKNYSIYLSSNNGKSFKKIGTTSKTTYTITKKLKRYTNYYVYVQANGVKYKGKKNNSTKPMDKGSNSSGFYIRVIYR